MWDSWRIGNQFIWGRNIRRQNHESMNSARWRHTMQCRGRSICSYLRLPRQARLSNLINQLPSSLYYSICYMSVMNRYSSHATIFQVIVLYSWEWKNNLGISMTRQQHIHAPLSQPFDCDHNFVAQF